MREAIGKKPCRGWAKYVRLCVLTHWHPRAYNAIRPAANVFLRRNRNGATP